MLFLNAASVRKVFPAAYRFTLASLPSICGSRTVYVRQIQNKLKCVCESVCPW